MIIQIRQKNSGKATATECAGFAVNFLVHHKLKAKKAFLAFRKKQEARGLVLASLVELVKTRLANKFALVAYKFIAVIAECT